MKISRRMMLAAATFLTSAGLLGGVGAAQAKDATIGATGFLDGPAAQWGIALREAVEFTAAEANRDQLVKVDGEPVTFKVLTVNSGYTAEGAAAAANTMISEGIKVIIGPIGSPGVTGIKPIALRNNLLLVANSFAKNAIGPQWPLVFHSSPGPSGWADQIIKFAKGKFGDFKKVVLVAPNDQGGTDIASVDAEVYRANGVEAIEEYYQRDTKNFAPIVTRIMNENPDVVDLASSSAGEAGIVVKQLRQAGFEGFFMRLGGPSYSEISRIAGGDDVLKNFIWYEPILIDDNVRRIETSYKELMGKDRPENNLFFQWVVAARMAFKAMAAAGSVDDTQKIAEAMRALDVSDPDIGQGSWIGQKFFGINQEMSFPFGIGMVQDGALQPLIPAPASTED